LNFQNLFGGGMVDFEEQIVHELKKLNWNFERILEVNKEHNDNILRLNAKLSEVLDYSAMEFFDDEEDNIRKKITWKQLAMIIQSLQRIESSLSGNKD
jgi:hypothetical protein